MRRTLLTIGLLGAALAGCGGSDPFSGDDVLVPDASVAHPDAPAGSADAAPTRSCAAAPTRVIVLGDSIMACSVIGGPQAAACVSKQVSDYVIAHYGVEAVYENYAVGGAKLVDLQGQLDGIPAGDGPALVVIYIGGNDLSPYIFQSDDAATAGWAQASARMDTAWAGVFTALADHQRFPAGATALMNTQYNPFDDCTAPPYNLSPVKIGILHDFNAKMHAIADAAGDAAVLVDQFTPFLGHGHHYDVATCPHYEAGAAPWMEDTIHANAAGNVGLAAVMEAGVDRLYRDCTP